MHTLLDPELLSCFACFAFLSKCNTESQNFCQQELHTPDISIDATSSLVLEVKNHHCALLVRLLLELASSFAGAVVFDVFKTWRLDSGDYSKYAEAVVCAWEGRCTQLSQQGAGPQGVPQQRPALMHSNLKDVDHVKQVAE